MADQRPEPRFQPGDRVWCSNPLVNGPATVARNYYQAQWVDGVVGGATVDVISVLLQLDDGLAFTCSEKQLAPLEEDPKSNFHVDQLPASSASWFTPEEQEIVDHIVAAMEGIKKLGLIANEAELAHHVHGIQMFVLMHAMQRMRFQGTSSWYYKDPVAEVTNP